MGKGGIHTKKNNKTMEISNKTKSNQSDLNKIELISSENVEVIPKHVRARGSKGKFILKTSTKTNSNQSDLNKIELISSENVEVISKHVRARGSKGKFIRNTQANDTNVNIVGETSGVLQNNDRVSKE